MAFRRPVILLWMAALVFGVLLFAGDGRFESRSLDRLWDLGHLPAFALFTYLLVTHWQPLARRPFGAQMLAAIGIMAFLGWSVEVIQLYVGRTFSWLDLRKDLLGVCLGLVFCAPRRKELARSVHLGLMVLLVAWVMWEAAPAGRALADESIARRQFPLLSGLETPFERERWSGDAPYFIARSVHHQGEASLRAELGTDRYSGVALEYFPRDWRGYAFLKIDLFNPEPEPIALTCRVNDRAHDLRGYRYEDRFNRSFQIVSGWQTISIPLEEIRTAPAQREMQMDDIANLAIFAVRLPRPRTVYIDNVRLAP